MYDNKQNATGIIIGFWAISITTIFIMLIHSGCNINYEIYKYVKF